ncbi:MAG: hypothetical protein LBQ36_05245, partial [Synergistaceae bacterium]|nr:hypothetical protein [Synergistaceae bacterium]
RIFEGIGLGVNAFFGPDGGVDELASAPDASLSVVFSKWGRFAGDFLEGKYGVPQLVLASPPTGIGDVRAMARAVAEAIGFDEEPSCLAEGFLKKEESYFQFFLSALDDYYDEIAGTPIAVVGDERTLIGVGGFLKEYLGAAVEEAIVTDLADCGESGGPSPLDSIAHSVHRSQDGREIREILKRSSARMILGSSLEADAARRMNVPHLLISYPAGGVMLNKTYSGIRGAIRLAEDYASKALEGLDLAERLALEIISGARAGD